MSGNLVRHNLQLIRREFFCNHYFRARHFCRTPMAPSSMGDHFAGLQPDHNNNLCRISDEELDSFHERRIFNTETWHQVVERQKRRAGRGRGPGLSDAEGTSHVPVIVQEMLQENESWKSRVASGGEPPTPPETLKVKLHRVLQEHALKYPFAEVDLVRPDDAKVGTVGDVLDGGDVSRVGRGLRRNRSAVRGGRDKTSGVPDVDRNVSSLYGIPNPAIPTSTVACSGCGAMLHCQDTAVPGYLPSEVFESCTTRDLHGMVCQRCTFLANYDVALKVRVRPQDYVSVVSQIATHRSALAILMVDLVDFPCSVWPGIVDVIGGAARPLFVVGNKVDLLARDGRRHLERVTASLSQSLRDCGIDRGKNVKHVCLISAKTGYGVEELISKLQSTWGTKGNIFLIGCTNVGKSSLFNALLQSDLCKTQAIDLIRRSTISIWPGTTLNLLKFPILYPNPRRMYERTKRLVAIRNQLNAERKQRANQLETTKDIEFATLTGHIGTTFTSDDSETGPKLKPFRKPFDESHSDFVLGKWVYDTPGVVHKDQITSLLTLNELTLTLPKSIINPRGVILKPGHSFFLAGLGRIDYIEGSESARLMIFSSSELPLSVTTTEEADEFYRKYLGSPVLKVPQGGSERLKDFPDLVAKEICLTGISNKESCADIVLSSAGWSSVCLSEGSTAKFLAFTPGGHGIHVRQPAIMPFAITLRGERIFRTPFCQPTKIFNG